MATKDLLPLNKGMSTSALIVVDLQHDFLPGGAIPTLDKNIDSVIGDLLSSRKFDLTVASQDWHPQVSTHLADPCWCCLLC